MKFCSTIKIKPYEGHLEKYLDFGHQPLKSTANGEKKKKIYFKIQESSTLLTGPMPLLPLDGNVGMRHSHM